MMKTHVLFRSLLLPIFGVSAAFAGSIDSQWENSSIWKFSQNAFDSSRAPAEGSVDVMEGKDGRELVIKYDFSKEGVIAGAAGALKVDGPVDSLVFSAKSDQPVPKLIVRYQDSTNQTHERSAKCAWAGEWEEVRIPLFDSANQPHWGGANDGMIHWPIKSIQFFIPNEGLGKPAGEISIKGIEAH